MEIVIRNNQRLLRINLRKVGKALRKTLGHLACNGYLKGHESVEVSVFFVNDRKMRSLNREYRGIDRTTDVLSFPQYDSNELKEKRESADSLLLLGDIVISPARAKSQAREYGLAFYGEINRLLIHGLLHLLGYDHETNRYQARKMRKMEEELLHHIEQTNA